MIVYDCYEQILSLSDQISASVVIKGIESVMIEIGESGLVRELCNDSKRRTFCGVMLILGPIQTHDEGMNGCSASSVMG